MYVSLSVCSLTRPNKNSSEGGDRAAPAVVLSFVFSLSLSLSLSLSRVRTLAFLKPEFRNACVCRPPPPLVCMGGCPPYTQVEGGVCTLTHSRIQESGTQEYFLCLIFYIYIYIYIYI